MNDYRMLIFITLPDAVGSKSDNLAFESSGRPSQVVLAPNTARKLHTAASIFNE